MPSIRTKLFALRYFSCLFSNWEEDFINDLWEGIDGTHKSLNDYQIEDYLHENQIQKIKEIWKTYSPYFNQELTEKVRVIMERRNFVEGRSEMYGSNSLSRS